MMAAYGDDPELLAAIRESMQVAQKATLVVPDEPSENDDPATFVVIQLRLPNATALKRRFSRSSTIGDIMNYYKVSSDNT